MSQQGKVNPPKVYSIQVSGIRCTNCAAKIKNGLLERLDEPGAKVGVNIIQEKISLTIFKETSAQKALEILTDIGFPAIGEPVPISGNSQNQRSIAFLINNNEQSQFLVDRLKSTLGIVSCSSLAVEGKKRVNITYDCQILKGKQLALLISAVDNNYQVINDRIDSFSKKGKIGQDEDNIKLTAILCLFFFIFNMIFPILPGHDQWYDQAITYPSDMGIYVISVIINFILACFVMIFYAKGFIVRAFKNYVSFGTTNMETLIALGSISSFSLFLFFLGRYSVQYGNGTLSHQDFHKAIMDINDSLTTSSIIVLVVTIGKYFQNKVKQKIEKMTEEIFPESTLFKDMSINFVQIKNRQLKIDKEYKINASLVEKNDVIRIVPGRLLLDVIIISGRAKAMQSARTGCEDIIEVVKGERLQSGSEVNEVDQCLAIVQNVLEKSLLIQIGTQVKLANNQEESEQSGIQAVCHAISNYFVKGVIILSIITIITWSLLLHFLTIDIPVCDICWVVERGIGVLVASCPCALGLAVPSVIAIILNLATKSGILIKNTTIFQKMKKARTIAFDKTGTLFTRINQIEEHIVLSETYPQAKMWEIVALIEKQIRHPLAQVLYKEAFSKCEIVGTNYSFILLEKPKIQKQGISAKILDKTKKEELQIFIGNKNILTNNQLAVPKFQKRTDASTELFLVVNKEPLLVLVLNTHSNLRPEAKTVIECIKKEGLEVHILSGDSAESVEKLGAFLNIPVECQHPETSTFMKMKWIKDVQKEGEQVAIMIGDGLNDIPCLQEAGIGISINAKSELNINAADVVILSENLHKILALVRFLKRGNLFININLFWAFAYNVVIMPITAGVFYPLDIFVSPVWSSIAMSCSSLIVVGFSHLLSCFSYDDSLTQKKQKMNPEEESYTEKECSELQIKMSHKKMRQEDEVIRKSEHLI